MENPSSLEQNFNVLSSLKVYLKHTKDQVAIRGIWDMVSWLKNVRDRELQVDEIKKEFKDLPNDLDAKDKLNRKLVESITAVKVLIEEGNAGSKSINYKLKLFSSEDLKKFTDFNQILGSGGYSDVYQGEFEGERVAVKVLKENDVVYETFLTERITMARIFHKNLVKLHGFCFDDDKKALVYEYMENGSLDKILYKNPSCVEWAKLYDIALGIARGLAYLHHDCSEQIIHHDVKAANVLLDNNLCPKITDFGVSNLMKIDATHITNTRIRGTHGYAAPEINRPIFPITCKCDVYSYGVMLFEILGRRCHILKDGVWFPLEVSEMWKKQPEKIMEYCDIMEEDREKAKIVLMVAMWCVQHTPPLRPSMHDVVEVLEKKMSVTTPPDPFLSHDPFGSSMLSSLQGIPVNDESSAEMKKYSQMDLEEFTSGFSNIIGTGSYGNVYKGKLRDGVEVAIKVLAHNFDFVQESFMNEGRILSKLYHKNIVRSYGYCFDKNMIAFVYEYIPCGSLQNILDENIEWERLYGIVIGIAKGLSYLHKGSHGRVIHSDLWPSNVLLDSNFSPKIKSFGLAKLISYHPNTRKNYDATKNEKINTKVDVLSFGRMILNVLGIKNCHKEFFNTRQIEEFIEDCGINPKIREDAKRLVKIALMCIQDFPTKRPSMGSVVDMLENRLPVTPLYKKIKASEGLLKSYEEKCPPGGENSVILYTTTIIRMKKSFKESNDVRTILKSHQIQMIERDVWGEDDVDFEDEWNDLLGIIQIPPVLFVKGRLIGGADEVKRLEADGKLKVLLYGIPIEE